MGNYLAIAATTATIIRLLKDIEKDVPGVIVTAKPLDLATKTASDGLNVFLFHVGPDAWLRNLPERINAEKKNTFGSLALRLSYLLTALTADNEDLKAQQILASAIGILHRTPVLTKKLISETIHDDHNIAGSDLAEQAEMIKLVHEGLSADELAKLWASFFNVNYRISTTYQARVVLLEGKQETESILTLHE